MGMAGGIEHSQVSFSEGRDSEAGKVVAFREVKMKKTYVQYLRQ